MYSISRSVDDETQPPPDEQFFIARAADYVDLWTEQDLKLCGKRTNLKLSWCRNIARKSCRTWGLCRDRVAWDRQNQKILSHTRPRRDRHSWDRQNQKLLTHMRTCRGRDCWDRSHQMPQSEHQDKGAPEAVSMQRFLNFPRWCKRRTAPTLHTRYFCVWPKTFLHSVPCVMWSVP